MYTSSKSKLNLITNRSNSKERGLMADINRVKSLYNTKETHNVGLIKFEKIQQMHSQK